MKKTQKIANWQNFAPKNYLGGEKKKCTEPEMNFYMDFRKKTSAKQHIKSEFSLHHNNMLSGSSQLNSMRSTLNSFFFLARILSLDSLVET